MSVENVRKTEEFIAAYNRRDFDAAVKDFHPQVDWVLPEHQDFDSCRGPAQIIRFWEGIDETFDELQLLPQETVDGGNRVAVRLRHRGRGKGSGLELDTELYHQITFFEDGLIVRFEYVTTWEQALEAVRLGREEPPAQAEPARRERASGSR
jgi:ketosteroid isomerase-like protein